MSTVKREFGAGKRDLAGDLIGSLRVLDIAGRNPWAWTASCERCGTRQVVNHASLASGAARCRNAACGKRTDTESLRAYHDRLEGEARSAANDANRRDAERLADAEAALTATSRKLYATVRERILTGQDEEAYCDPQTRDVTMTQAQADRFNAEQAAIFASATPDYYPSPKNLDAIGGYLERNGIFIVSAPTLKAAFHRLDGFGVLEHPPVVAVTPIAHTSAKAVETVEPKSTAIDGEEGSDLATGGRRFYTNYEIARMTAREYQKIFNVRPQLPGRAAY